MQYLAEVEEYISSLITYNAFKDQREDAAITYIPLDKLEAKDWKKVKEHLKLEKNELPITVDIVDEDKEYEKMIEAGAIGGRDVFARFNQY